jgi:hypothetical protein
VQQPRSLSNRKTQNIRVEDQYQQRSLLFFMMNMSAVSQTRTLIFFAPHFVFAPSVPSADARARQFHRQLPGAELARRGGAGLLVRSAAGHVRQLGGADDRHAAAAGAERAVRARRARRADHAVVQVHGGRRGRLLMRAIRFQSKSPFRFDMLIRVCDSVTFYLSLFCVCPVEMRRRCCEPETVVVYMYCCIAT